MNSLSINLRRRNLLKLFAASSAVVLLSGASAGCGLLETDLEKSARQMLNLLNHPGRAREIGASHIQRSAELQNYTFEQWTKKLLAVIEVDHEDISSATLESLPGLLRKQIQRDFSNEDVVIVDRWMLSDTELMLYSLAASFPHS